jgi:acyl carrier protein
MKVCTNDDIVRFLLESEAIRPEDEVAFDIPLKEMGVDSLDKFNLFLLIEENYGVTASDDEFASLNTVTAVAEFVSARLREASS